MLVIQSFVPNAELKRMNNYFQKKSLFKNTIKNFLIKIHNKSRKKYIMFSPLQLTPSFLKYQFSRHATLLRNQTSVTRGVNILPDFKLLKTSEQQADFPRSPGFAVHFTTGYTGPVMTELFNQHRKPLDWTLIKGAPALRSRWQQNHLHRAQKCLDKVLFSRTTVIIGAVLEIAPISGELI